MHELSHVLGLSHEHQRRDRDLYININVPDSIKPSFMHMTSDLYDMTKYPYDIKSITHYDSYLGGEVLPYTFISTKDYKVIPSNVELSWFDILKLRDLYPSKNRLLEI